MKSDMVYEFIQQFIGEHGMAPTVREIKEGLDFSSTSMVFRILQGLEAQGRIERTRNANGNTKARTIQMLAERN